MQALGRAYVRFALPARSTRHQDPRLCRNAASVQQELTASQAPRIAPSVHKEVTLLTLELRTAAFVRQALSTPSKAQFHRVTVTHVRPPSIRISPAPLNALLVPMASLPLPAFRGVRSCVLSVFGLRVG